MSAYIKNGRLVKSVSIPVPSRAALAGNPSDLAMDKGIGAVLSIPVRDFVGTVSIYPSEGFRIVGPETTAPTLLRAIENVADQGYSNGDHLIRAALSVFSEMVDSIRFKRSHLNMPMTFAWDTNIPRQRGMSGSSAIIASLLKGLLRIFGLEDEAAFRPELLAVWVLKVEEKLGITAGLQDRVLQAYATDEDVTAVFMDFSKEAFAKHDGEHGDYLAMRHGALPKMALLLSSKPSHSGAVHAPIRQKIEAGNAEVLAQMRELEELARRASEALASGNWNELGPIMTKNARMRIETYGKEAMGSTNLAMLDACEKAFCYGNFTGSGGAMIIYLPDEEDSLNRLRSEISHKRADQFEIYVVN